MARPTSNLRLFVAIYPPAQLALQLLGMVQELELPAHRPTSAEQVHLTLQFIGDTPAAELDATIESVQRSAAGISPFALTLQQLIALPERGPARLIAAQTDAPPGLMELQRRLATRLAHKPRAKPNDRFRPHLTLCRFRSPAQRLRIDQAIMLPAFAVESISLMRSTLSQERAQHHEVARVMLQD